MNTYTQTFEADTGKILNIVINSLYSDRDIFLREMLSNASDAIDTNSSNFGCIKGSPASPQNLQP